MKSLHVICDGGLANRLTHLYQSLYFSQLFNCNLILSWPINNWCSAEVDDLIDTQDFFLERNKKNLRDIYAESTIYDIMICHEIQIDGFKGNIVSSSLVNPAIFWKALNSFANGAIYFYGNSFLDWMCEMDMVSAASSIPFNPKLISERNIFSGRTTGGLRTRTGIHIRGTDFGDPTTVVSKAYRFISANPTRLFFVCSDERRIEDKFKYLSNCCIREKESFCTRFDSRQDWNGSTTDDIGRKYNFNIFRGKQATIEGLVDLLCLAQCGFLIRTSSSTFFRLAKLLSLVLLDKDDN